MALHGYVSDLVAGDVFEPVTYRMSPFVIREYCHGTEEDWAGFHGAGTPPGGVQVAAPTLAHIEKIRLLQHNCPGGPGPNARIHVEYHATHHAPIPAGTDLITSGRVVDRFLKRGRSYLRLDLEVRSAATGQLFTSYSDIALLAYEPTEDARDERADT